MTELMRARPGPSRPAAAGSSSTLTSSAIDATSEDGTCGSGLASGPNAAATASAFDVAGREKHHLSGIDQPWHASCETRATKGSRPASGTPTTDRDRSLKEAWSGNSEAQWPSGPIPSSTRSNFGDPASRSCPLVVRPPRPRVRARPSSDGSPATPAPRARRTSPPSPSCSSNGRRRAAHTARHRTTSCTPTRRFRPRGPRRRTPRTPPAVSTHR